MTFCDTRLSFHNPRDVFLSHWTALIENKRTFAWDMSISKRQADPTDRYVPSLRRLYENLISKQPDFHLSSTIVAS